MKTAIVILNYMTYELTLSCVNQLNSLNLENVHLIIVDNASPNNSFESMNEVFTRDISNYNFPITLIRSDENRGYSAGNNLGIKEAIKLGIKYAIVMNNDVVVTDSNIIKKFIDKIELDDKIAVIGPKVITNGEVDPPLIINRPSGIKMFIRNILYPIYVVLGRIKRISVNKFEEMYIYAVSGCFQFMDLEKLATVGLFDEDVFLYVEEYILGEKLYQSNFKALYAPSIYVHHYHSVTINSIYNKKRREQILNNSLLIYFTKYRTDINYKIIEFLKLTQIIKINVYFAFFERFDNTSKIS